MPLRAFGNVKFKWSIDTLKSTASLLGLSPSYPVTPQFYISPPYLSSEPEIRKLSIDPSCHRFLIIASDGLWDKMSPMEAVQTVEKCWSTQRHIASVFFAILYRVLKCSISWEFVGLEDLGEYEGETIEQYRIDGDVWIQ